MDHNLPQYLRAVYEYIGRVLPQELEELCTLHESDTSDNRARILDEYTYQLQELLEFMGWKRSDNYHWAWRTILLESDDRKRVVSLGLIPLVRESWVGTISLYTDWPPDWLDEQKLIFLSEACHSIKPEELATYYGQPTVTLWFEVGHLTPHSFFPENVERCESWSKFRTLIEQLGFDRLVRGKNSWKEEIGNDIAKFLNIS